MIEKDTVKMDAITARSKNWEDFALKRDWKSGEMH